MTQRRAQGPIGGWAKVFNQSTVMELEDHRIMITFSLHVKFARLTQLTRCILTFISKQTDKNTESSEVKINRYVVYNVYTLQLPGPHLALHPETVLRSLCKP